MVDKACGTLERWKHRVIGAFLLFSAVLGLTALLILEAAVVVRVWREEFSNTRTAPRESGIFPTGKTET
jgi:hypothetical protein